MLVSPALAVEYQLDPPPAAAATLRFGSGTRNHQLQQMTIEDRTKAARSIPERFAWLTTATQPK